MSNCIFMKENGFAVPRANPETQWVFDQVTIAVSPSNNDIQLSDINVLDIHDLEVVDAFRILRDVLSWLPEDVVFTEQHGTRTAELRRTDFYYESEPTGE